MGADLMSADGRNKTKIVIGFREYANAPKNCSLQATDSMEQNSNFRNDIRSVNQEIPLHTCNPQLRRHVHKTCC